MRTPVRRLAALWIALLTAAVVSAQPAGRPAIAFTVSTPNPSAHLYHVTMRSDGLRETTAEFRMPVWTPGYYGIFDFAGNVRNFAAADAAGRPLAWKKSGPNAWTVTKAAGGAVTLSYDVFADKPFVANAFLDETRGYITPGALFLYVPGRLREPVTVTIDLDPRWTTVATGLEPVASGAPHTYLAEDFDVLYDSPILIGNLESLPPFEIDGIPHYFIGYGMDSFDRKQFMDDLRAVVEAGTKIIGDIPYRHYTFLGIGRGQGGIEHLNSAAVSFTAPGSDRAGRIRTLSFLAHEYFHHYNVKRIRPVALGPFDYDKANLTNMLWVSEGFTVYYEYLMLGRSGLMTRDEVLAAMGRTIASYENHTGRLFQSVTQSSAETWAQGPFGAGRGTGIRKTISYYEKGPAMGLLLDFAIRHATKNQRSLDTVMRALYRQYYKELKRGWTDEEFREVCERTAGVSLDEIFQYASTTREIDYAKYLGYAGLQLERPVELPDAFLGALAEEVDGKLVIAATEPGSPAAGAGLAAGDVIRAVDGSAVPDAPALRTAVAARKPGDRILVSITRKDGPHDVAVTLAHALRRSFKLEPIANPDALQSAILASLTEGAPQAAAAAAARPAGTDRPSAHDGLATRIVQKGLREQGAYATLKKILAVGPRLTGSAQADAAVAAMAAHMKALGFENVRTEPTVVGRWVRGPREAGRIVSKTRGAIPVKVRAIGNSMATPAGGITAGVIEVQSLAELEKIGDKARGRIVFFNGALDPTHLDTFAAYGGAAAQRAGGAAAAARAGAVAAVVRSLTFEIDDDPHTGMMAYDAVSRKIPAVTISTQAADRLSEILRAEPNVRFHFVTTCRTLDPVTSHNVMGELRGAEKPDEVIVVGGHLDSWDLSPGAHDDGAGCAQSIEALRLLKELGVKPRRTIRAVLFMDEENGGTGGRDYARSPNRRHERHLAAVESDRGGFLPLGIGVGAKGAAFDKVKAWEPLFQRIGLQWVRQGGGGVDIAPLGEAGTVLMELLPDSQRYFDVHHSGTDTIDKVNPRELELGASGLALLAYLLSEEGL